MLQPIHHQFDRSLARAQCLGEALLLLTDADLLAREHRLREAVPLMAWLLKEQIAEMAAVTVIEGEVL